jgi:hypothetical protein
LKFQIAKSSVWGSGVNKATTIAGVAVGLAIPLTQGTSGLTISIALAIGLIGLFTTEKPKTKE